MNYSLRDAEAEDKPWLEALRRDAYKELFDLTWGEWSEDRHQKQFSACLERGHIQIIEDSDSPIGMLQMFESEYEITIGEFQITPNRQSQGLGTKVLGDVIERARHVSKDIALAAGLKNVRACKFYKKLGFQETRRSETHIHMAYTIKKLPPSANDFQQ